MTPSTRLRQLADELFEAAADAGPGPVDDLLTAAAREALSAACFAAEGERRTNLSPLAVRSVASAAPLGEGVTSCRPA
jgi:hypothetical protein